MNLSGLHGFVRATQVFHGFFGFVRATQVLPSHMAFTRHNRPILARTHYFQNEK
ncbi:MAG TPA: hypothetical protein PKY59_01925 [Pyrinomonadaceae bacterium]|nr:hypothetical protein [Pyrinomonadaceae bacterium]